MRKYNLDLPTPVSDVSLQGILRAAAVVVSFFNRHQPPGRVSLILQHLSILLEMGDLNRQGSVELAQSILQQGRRQLLVKCFEENKVRFARRK